MAMLHALCLTEDQRDRSWNQDWRRDYGHCYRHLLKILIPQQYIPTGTVMFSNRKYYRPPFVVETRNGNPNEARP